MFDAFQGMEWVIILLVILLIFGPSKLPQLARGLGQAVYEFRRASQGLLEEDQGGKPPQKSAGGVSGSKSGGQGSALSNIDDETLRRLAERLGVKDADKKDRGKLIEEIVAEAKKKGLLDEIKTEAQQGSG
ncbi:translocase [Pyrodictium occultum]|uniref:Sec-independent protein translocase protein TatA n=1 Tax=Pyrodictium occultum TaxID=2309 RepID=A0A0V8RVW7_PYROC|nr:twin-arginine translocase TatA/TatE family subunit [Pyrodictium occultum]KSW12179.1 translocase [Pyrodictium occultum]